MKISIEIELDEALHDSLVSFLESRPEWSTDRAAQCAISLFLLQNRNSSDKATARIYLDTLFDATASDPRITRPRRV